MNESANLATLKKLLRRQGNDKCADCLAPNPRNISMNFGIFLCAQCANVHTKGLGPAVSRIRPIVAIVWTDSRVARVERAGNLKFNAVWEARLSPSDRPSSIALADPSLRSSFITSKYVQRQWATPDLTRGGSDSRSGSGSWSGLDDSSQEDSPGARERAEGARTKKASRKKKPIRCSDSDSEVRGEEPAKPNHATGSMPSTLAGSGLGTGTGTRGTWPSSTQDSGKERRRGRKSTEGAGPERRVRALSLKNLSRKLKDSKKKQQQQASAAKSDDEERWAPSQRDVEGGKDSAKAMSHRWRSSMEVDLEASGEAGDADFKQSNDIFAELGHNPPDDSESDLEDKAGGPRWHSAANSGFVPGRSSAPVPADASHVDHSFHRSFSPVCNPPKGTGTSAGVRSPAVAAEAPKTQVSAFALAAPSGGALSSACPSTSGRAGSSSVPGTVDVGASSKRVPRASVRSANVSPMSTPLNGPAHFPSCLLSSSTDTSSSSSSSSVGVPDLIASFDLLALTFGETAKGSGGSGTKNSDTASAGAASSVPSSWFPNSIRSPLPSPSSSSGHIYEVNCSSCAAGPNPNSKSQSSNAFKIHHQAPHGTTASSANAGHGYAHTQNGGSWGSQMMSSTSSSTNTVKTDPGPDIIFQGNGIESSPKKSFSDVPAKSPRTTKWEHFRIGCEWPETRQ